MGLVEGPFMPVCQSLLAGESDDSRRGHNMGVMQNFGSNLLGSFVAPLVLVPLAAHWNWRAAFFLAGVPGLVMAVLIPRYVHEPQEKSQTATGSAGGGSALSAFATFGPPNMLLCVFIGIFIVAWVVLGWAFLPLFYVK